MAQRRKSGVHAVLLAAGASRRFGDDNKLLVEIAGVPLVRAVAVELLRSRAASVIVVTGFEAGAMREVLGGLDLRLEENPGFASGLASSISCGVSALREDAAGAMITLGDMPGMRVRLIDRLIALFEEEQGKKIIFPAREDGSQGNPVLWPARHFADLKRLTGDAGAKHLIEKFQDKARALILESSDALDDIDTPGDLAPWLSGDKQPDG